MRIMASGAGLLSLTAALAGSALALGAPALAEPLPYGPDTCIQGFVWREAFDGDVVCVTPAVRSQAAGDNAAAGSRFQRNQPVPAPAAPPPQPEPQTRYEGPSAYDLDGRKPCGTGLPGDRNFDRDFCEILVDQPR